MSSSNTNTARNNICTVSFLSCQPYQRPQSGQGQYQKSGTSASESLFLTLIELLQKNSLTSILSSPVSQERKEHVCQRRLTMVSLHHLRGDTALLSIFYQPDTTTVGAVSLERRLTEQALGRNPLVAPEDAPDYGHASDTGHLEPVPASPVQRPSVQYLVT